MTGELPALLLFASSFPSQTRSMYILPHQYANGPLEDLGRLYFPLETAVVPLPCYLCSYVFVGVFTHVFALLHTSSPSGRVVDFPAGTKILVPTRLGLGNVGAARKGLGVDEEEIGGDVSRTFHTSI